MRVCRSLAAFSGAAVLVTTFALNTGQSPAPAYDPVPVAASYPSGGLFSNFLDQIREALEKAALQAAQQAAEQAAAQRPAQVTGVTATAGDARIDLGWSVPSSRRSITGYTVSYAPQGGTARTTTVSTNQTTLTRLTNGTTYSITLTATSSAGTGPASTAVSATPMTVAGAPTGLVVVPGDGQVAATWQAPGDNGGAPVTEYVVTASPVGSDADATTRVRQAGRSATLDGLKNDVPYAVSVAAVNAAGVGPASLASTAAPIAPPGEAPAEPAGETPTPGRTPESPVSTPEAPVSTPEAPVGTPEAPVTTPETPVSTPEPSSGTPATGDYRLAAAGFNGAGQLLTGAADQSAHSLAALSTSLGGLSVDKVSVGETSTCALADGRAYCWGANADGQLGNGTTTDSAQPVQVAGALAGKTVTDISVGIRQTCAVADANAYCWGSNTTGQLGTGNTTNSTVPVAVSTAGLLNGKIVTSISTQRGHTCALAEGKAYCWGDNGYGQLGNDSATNSSVPVAVSVAGALKGKSVTALSAGFLQNCVIADAKAYCWGYNGYGALGNDSTTSSAVPVAVYQGEGVLAGQAVTQIDSRGYSTCATAGAKAYCWGYNVQGSLGNSTSNDRQVPFPVFADAGPLKGKTITKVVAGLVERGPVAGTACALTTDGTAACWGTSNSYGSLADGTTSGSRIPVAVKLNGDLAGAAISDITTNGRTSAFLLS